MCRPISYEQQHYVAPIKGYDAKASRKEYLRKLKELMKKLERNEDND